VSKAQLIRKKALDLVRDQDWPGAIKEYRRLVELDQSNPNVHNELADIYLKTGQKAEAYDAFVRAVDEYTRVGLFNNAVAVCKKVLRVLPARSEMLVKLGFIRGKQGLAREAESYYLQFLDKAAAANFTPEDFQKLAGPIAEEMPDSTVVLDRLSQALLGYRLDDEAGNVLVRLFVLHESRRDEAGMEKARAAIEKLGMTAKLDAARKTMPPADGRTVITEGDLWTKTHTEGERIGTGSDGKFETTPKYEPPRPTAAPGPQPTGAAPGGPSERDLYLLRLARGSAEARPAAPAAPAAAAATDAAGASAVAVEAPSVSPAPGPAPGPAPAPPKTEPSRAPAPMPALPPSGEGMQISALIDDDGTSADGEADFRSHYDLGMAYLEMDLLAEAIREYQFAAKSAQYQVKCLEMIGLCFLKQSQPQLAIRQLSKGLSLIGTESEESLGIKYNLGLAHEMVGDFDRARTCFEDVYVVDVTFRDVAEKIRKLTGSG
jgi:tetratricopeptide (TPR) repeat protein